MSRRKKRPQRVPPTVASRTPREPAPTAEEPPDARTEAEVLADEIIATAQAAAPSIGGTRGDTAGLIMHGAYVKGFRRFAAIRMLAGRHDGAEAIILTRTLLSMVARAAYVDAPDDTATRKARWEQFQVTNLRDRLKMIADLADTGFDVDTDTTDLQADLDELENRAISALPNDHDLLESLNLKPFYARLYRPGSEHVHFSLNVAVDEMRDANVVRLEAGDPELADEALRLAIITYGQLLELSEKTVKHGLSARVIELVKPVLSGADGSRRRG
jgi:hypothetical protein